MNYIKCNKCGWVHFSVTAEYVKKWKTNWAVFWSTLSEKHKDGYGLLDGPPDYDEYLYCQRCGESYINFKDALPEEVPYGSTIGGILDRTETIE